MKKNKLSVTIGIPAYNEEANIGLLLTDLFRQKRNKYSLDKILVASDGSTDKTVGIIEELKNKKVVIFDNMDRRGPAVRQNQIIQNTDSDILILLNADIRIKSQDFITNLILPIVGGEAELTSCAIREFPPKTFVESILEIGMKLKTVLFETWNNGQNGYLCHGTARAFSRSFYSKLRFKGGEGEDMYTYLECLKRQYRFKFVRNICVWYRNPATLADHFKQSYRYFKYQADFLSNYKSEFVARELKIPVSIYFRSATKVLGVVFRYPIHVFGYLVLVCSMFVLSRLRLRTGDLWDVTSTKTR